MSDVLVIDLQMMPLNFVSWDEAVKKVLKGRVNVVAEDKDRIIHSPNFEMNMPLVIQVKNRFARKMRRRVPMTRRNFLIRDDYKCQYCGCDIDTHEYTQDHVIPRSKGGETSWTNLVVACNDCNGRKANRTPAEANMRLRKAPVEPSVYDARFNFRLHINKLRPEWQPWSTWLYWNVELEK